MDGYRIFVICMDTVDIHLKVEYFKQEKTLMESSSMELTAGLEMGRDGPLPSLVYNIVILKHNIKIQTIRDSSDCLVTNCVYSHNIVCHHNFTF